MNKTEPTRRSGRWAFVCTFALGLCCLASLLATSCGRSRPELIAVVPDERKAQAVKNSLEGEIIPMVPASILRRHSNVTIYLDKDSAALLTSAVPAAT